MAGRVVDPQYRPFTIATPAGTAIAAPQTTALAVPHGQLLVVELTIPPGHAGATGFRLELAGEAILPFSRPAAWILGDGLHLYFDMDTEVDRGLNAITYNTGNFPHTHFLRLKLRTVFDKVLPSTPTLVDLNRVV